MKIADELMTDISKIKQQLYPLIDRAKNLNPSAGPDAARYIEHAYDILDNAFQIIKDRAV